MGNCIKTQLKGVVENDNLPIFGKIQMVIANNYVIQLGLGAGSVISSPDGTFSIANAGADNVSNVNEHTFSVDHINDYVKIVPSINNQKFVFDKYDMYYLDNQNPSETSQNAQINLKEEDVEFVKKSLSFANVEYNFDISKIHVSNSLEKLAIAFNSLCVGDLSNLDVKNIVILNFSSTNITGDLKAMCEKSWELGRKSGSIRLYNLSQGESETKRMWGTQTVYEACGNYNPWIVFTNEGVSLSATQPV